MCSLLVCILLRFYLFRRLGFLLDGRWSKQRCRSEKIAIRYTPRLCDPVYRIHIYDEKSSPKFAVLSPE